MNMSFYHTQEQIRDHSKTVTRRRENTWQNLKLGDRLNAVAKSQGLKKGEKVEVLAVIEVVSVTTPWLEPITSEDVIAEGFPDMEPEEFVKFLCRVADYDYYARFNLRVRRIEFKYID